MVRLGNKNLSGRGHSGEIQTEALAGENTYSLSKVRLGTSVESFWFVSGMQAVINL